jgi:hypothetical protein
MLRDGRGEHGHANTQAGDHPIGKYFLKHMDTSRVMERP